MARGSEILALDYVTIQNKAEALLGAGSITRGYGQSVASTDVAIGNTITKEQWDLLRFDIVNIRVHQDGALPSIITVNRGDPIGFGEEHPNTNYNTLLESAIINKFEVASNQSIVSAVASEAQSSPWSTSAQSILTTTFPSADSARFFFNSGGKIRITTTLTGSSNNAQNNAWVNFLNTVGTQSFGAATNQVVNFYTLTNSYQTYYQGGLTGAYSANSYVLEARCNVANNSTGTATIVEIRIRLTDAYVDTGALPPPDEVNGTLAISVDELKAAGSLIPTGSFSITSPTYSLSSIVVS